MPPVKPMLAKPLAKLPLGDVSYEPKWDGFRCVVFRDGDEVLMGSRNEKPLNRYFPEMIEPFLASLPDRCVVDGEIFIAIDGRLDFDALGQRIHPADSRVQMLAEKTPADFVAFDILALDTEALVDRPFGERRAVLEDIAQGSPRLSTSHRQRVTPRWQWSGSTNSRGGPRRPDHQAPR